MAGGVAVGCSARMRRCGVVIQPHGVVVRGGRSAGVSRRVRDESHFRIDVSVI